MPEPKQSTVNEEQLALFQNHVELQKQELTEQSTKNRADEAIEMRRISAEQDMHGKNLEHAGLVIKAQAGDRTLVRSFWSKQLGRTFSLVITLIVVFGVISSVAIFKGSADSVFSMMGVVLTHALSLAAGVGMDRAWMHRKRTGITSNVDE